MRKFKKALAVITTAVMTMAMGVSAFAADTKVTFHFYDAQGWGTVGAWVKQGVDWKDDCLPTDKCVTNEGVDENGNKYVKPLWPGAKMEAEGNGWYKVTCTYSDASKGSMMIFNNYVADSKPTDTTTEEDIQKLKDAGVTMDTEKAKVQTPNICIKKNELTANEYWINWDGNVKGSMIVLGKSDMMTDTAPANYSTGNDNTGDTGNTGNTGDTGNTGNTGDAGNTGNAGNAGNTGSTGNTGSNKPAPGTGDAVSVSVVLLGLVAVVAVVAAKKKVNA